MEIIANKKHLLNTTQLQKFQTFNEIKDEFSTISLTRYRVEFEQLLNNTFIIDLSDSSSVTHGFEVLSYFGCDIELFFKQLVNYIVKKEKKQIEAFFERHIDKVNWVELSGNTNISEQFFDRHIGEVDWEGLSRNTNISEQFFERHINKVDWVELSGNTNISEE